MIYAFLKGFIGCFVIAFCIRAFAFYSIGEDFFQAQWLELDSFLQRMFVPCFIVGISFVASYREKQKKVKKVQSSV